MEIPFIYAILRIIYGFFLLLLVDMSLKNKTAKCIPYKCIIPFETSFANEFWVQFDNGWDR